MSRWRPVRDVAEDYEVLVLRWPEAPNAELAAMLGMSKAALERALSRARSRGILSIRRASDGRRVWVDRTSKSC